MGGRASRGWWWGAALLCACQPYSGGVGTGGANTLGVPDTGEAATDDAEDATASMGEAGTTASLDTGTDPSGPPDATTLTGPGDDTSTTGEPPATTGEGEASLTISDGPRYDFGDVPTGGQASHVFSVTNQGDGDALGLGGTLAAPFGFPGGFPGAAGTCTDALGAGESCTIEVTFAPGQIGVHVGTLAVSHAGGADATREVVGGAAGQTDNLLANPGGESFGNPPPSWTEALGEWIAGAVPMETAAYSGSGYLYADTGPNNTDYSLRQDVDLGSLAATVDGGLLRLAFSGRARALDVNNDQHRIRVHYLDGGGGTLQVWTTDYQSVTAWQEYADTRAAPAGTRTVRVELNCRKNSGTWCNAYFDALDLRASYP